MAPLRRVHPFLATFTLILDLDCSVCFLHGLYLLIEPITKYDTIVGRVMKSMMTYECGRIKEDKVAFRTSTICDIVIDGVWEVHKSMTRDAVESKIKNWLRHCPRYAFKNNEDEKINGEDEFRQVDSDY
ncbi:hypothetical protein OUZ56_017254 [Daphnia magna]|uniref:Uncharacterized protein n=1 Tax=Daphnia magna TaxID=35525 RepID=A0ABR0ASH9_9CRUS|nr:hypothetical protein OUZ56_017254 [Daphnia magna]